MNEILPLSVDDDRVVVFVLGFNHAADILTPELCDYNSGKNRAHEQLFLADHDPSDEDGYAEFMRWHKESLDIKRQLKSDFLLYLRELVPGGLSRHVEVYNGSDRQDQISDQQSAQLHENGLSIPFFDSLCGVQGWEMRRLLLADVDNGELSGSAMIFQDLELVAATNSVEKFLREMKIDMLSAQIADVRQIHGERVIDLYFFDARKDILNAVACAVAGYSLEGCYKKWCKKNSMDCHGVFADDPVLLRSKEEEGPLLFVPDNVRLHLLRVNWKKEYRSMLSEERGESKSFITEMPLLQQVVEKSCCSQIFHAMTCGLFSCLSSSRSRVANYEEKMESRFVS